MEPAKCRVLLGSRQARMRPRLFVLPLVLLALGLICPNLALAWGPVAHDVVIPGRSKPCLRKSVLSLKTISSSWLNMPMIPMS